MPGTRACRSRTGRPRRDHEDTASLGREEPHVRGPWWTCVVASGCGTGRAPVEGGVPVLARRAWETLPATGHSTGDPPRGGRSISIWRWPRRLRPVLARLPEPASLAAGTLRTPPGAVKRISQPVVLCDVRNPYILWSIGMPRFGTVDNSTDRSASTSRLTRIEAGREGQSRVPARGCDVCEKFIEVATAIPALRLSLPRGCAYTPEGNEPAGAEATPCKTME